MKLTVQDWGKLAGWSIIDEDADCDDGEGGYDPMNRLYVHGFNSAAEAHAWLRVLELARALNVPIKCQPRWLG